MHCTYYWDIETLRYASWIHLRSLSVTTSACISCTLTILLLHHMKHTNRCRWASTVASRKGNHNTTHLNTMTTHLSATIFTVYWFYSSRYALLTLVELQRATWAWMIQNKEPALNSSSWRTQFCLSEWEKCFLFKVVSRSSGGWLKPAFTF